MTLLRAVLLAALWVCFTVLSAATALADDPIAKQGVAPDQNSAALLQEGVHQIVAGHTVSPLEDNALATWEGVRKRAQEMTPGTEHPLNDFVSLAENHAETERLAGREIVAFDLQAFADMAQELLQRGMMHAGTLNAQSAGVRAGPSVIGSDDCRSGVVGVRRIEAVKYSFYAALATFCFSRAQAAVSSKVCMGVLPKHQRPWCVRCWL
jgi:hypothetical protein